MTLAVKEKIIQKLGEAGLIFLLMGIVIFVLHKRSAEQEVRIYDRLDKLEGDIKECNDARFRIMLDINNETIKVIERNTDVLNKLNR